MDRLRAVDPGDVPVVAREALLAELLTEPRPIPARRAWRRASALALAGAAAATVAALAVAVPGGAPDARAELIAAAHKTTAFTSGRVTLRTVTDPPLGDFHGDNVMVSRFDGRAGEVTFTPRGEHAGVGGQTRTVGGRRYYRNGDGAWKEGPAQPGTGQVTRLQDELQVAGALEDIVRAAAGVTREERADATVYHAQVDAAALPSRKLGDPVWPSGPVQVDVTVAADGTLAELDLHVPAQRWDVTFAQLGQPQEIVAP